MRTIYTVFFVLLLTTGSLAADLKSLEYFAKSMYEIQARFNYEEKIIKKKGVQVVTDEQMNQLLSYTKNSLYYSNKVLNKDLDKADPALFNKTLAKNYEILFRQGLRLSIVSMESNDLKKGLKSQKLLNKWGKYYRKIRKKIL